VTFGLELSRSALAASEARHALERLSGRLSAATLGDVRLLVSELVTNSVRHAGLGSQDTIRLEVSVTDTALRVEVRDPGDGFMPRTPAPDADRTGGWGLYLVEQLADRWGVDTRSGTRVWFEVDRRPTSA
jgi:anti-sigma regulatory factor (Ser/Thr protein kinase)